MRDVRTYLIIGLVAVIVILLHFQRSPEPVEDTRKYDSLVQLAREGEAKAIELSQQRHRDSVSSIESNKRYSETVKKKDAQIAYYRSHPKVIEIIREVPVIDSAFRAYDSAIVIRDNRIATLSSELYNCQKLATSAEINFQATLHAHQGAKAELLEDIQGYKKDLKREKRKGRFAKVLIPVALIGGFLLGSQ